MSKQCSIHCHPRELNWWKVFLSWYLKLVESFLELVFNEKSMLVDTVKKPFR